MALQGNTKLELIRDGRVVKRIEKHNTITPWVQNAIGAGNFHYSMLGDKIMPISQWFNGCLLTDNENNASLQMIAGNSEVTAQAGANTYSGTNLKRGSFNANESGKIAGGYRFVWDWNTAQGNGRIASVCLTRSLIGQAEYYTSDNPADDGYVNELISGSSLIETDTDSLGKCNIIDYAKHRGYFVRYSNGSILVDEFNVSTSALHLTHNRFSADLIDTHTISQTVSNYALNTASVSYTGNVIHLLTFGRNTGTLNDYAINTETWTVTATTHTYSGVSFTEFPEWRTVLIQKDAMPIIDGYVYAYSNSGAKIVKCNLTNDADVTSYDNPLVGSGVSDLGKSNGGCILLPNGDWYKLNRVQLDSDYGIYYHNGVFNRVRIRNCGISNAYAEVGANANDYGTQIITAYSGLNGQSYMKLTTMFPYVSTVNNLEETVTKDVTMYMKLTYELTEVSS